MKVLIGVDGSSNSFAAVEFVGRLLSPERDELVLAFATPGIAFDDDRLDPAIEQRARSALSRTILEAALERLSPEWHARAQQRQIEGNASAALLNAIEAEKANLIAVGFRGTSNIMEALMPGTVSRAIVHTAKIPVLVVRSDRGSEEPVKQSPGSPARHMHALVAYGDPGYAGPTTELLKKLAWPPETRSWLMIVVQPMQSMQLPKWVKIERDPDVAAMASAWEAEHQQNVQAARVELEQFRAALPECFGKGDVIVAEGRPADEILNQIREKAIDLAVLGSRGRGSLQRLLLGSTSEQVLREAPCSVLIVR